MTEPVVPERGPTGPGCSDDLDISFNEYSQLLSTEKFEIELGEPETPLIYGLSIE